MLRALGRLVTPQPHLNSLGQILLCPSSQQSPEVGDGSQHKGDLQAFLELGSCRVWKCKML